MATGRPSTKVGQYGHISFTHRANRTVLASVHVRDSDGVARRVRAIARTEVLADRKLKERIASRSDGVVAGDLTRESYFMSAARVWLEQAQTDVRNGGRRRPQTVARYERILRAQAVPRLGRLRLGEMTVSRIEGAVYEIVAEGHYRKAQLFRETVCQVLDMCVRMDVVHDNAARKTRKPAIPNQRKPQALSVGEVREVREAVRLWRNDGKQHLGPRPDGKLPVCVDVMLGSGIRIGEALALRWGDFAHLAGQPYITVAATMVELEGKVVYQPETKSKSGQRRIILPGFAIRALLSIRPENTDPQAFVFASRSGKPIQPGNMRRSLNKALEAYGMDPALVHPHLFRSTVGTAIAHGGFSVSDASKVLGHSAPAVTEKYYIEELRNTPDVTAALDALVGERG
ncbi:tyrosine-type recombinase/integrase [Isoptericola sp. NPDC019571]|uniref:tyrosine-type recombinase/integrase n=1 Tax=Isoptericola sp. NPDC019571 TaxID=3364008 RepID=UPI0037BD2626